ncbi:MAG: M48 family metallopeptidase [Planctomycetota bacterium]
MKHIWPLTGRAFALVLSLALLSGCSVKLMSWQEEIELGNEAAPQFLAEGGGQVPDQEVVAYVREIGTRLVAGVDHSQLPEDLVWEFHVLDSSVINAFALPGGKVFMSRGLMEKMTNEAQLAGVLGHEIGHVTRRHGNQRISQAMLIQFGVVGLAVAGSLSDSEWAQMIGLGAAAGGQLYLLKYTRDQETEADFYGVQYMAAAGYNPVGQVQVMEILREASGGQGGPEWLSTHPAPDTRISDLQRLIVRDYPDFDKPGAYVFRQDEFQSNILARLRSLPPPRHGSPNAMIGPEAFEALTGIAWGQVEHAGCDCKRH